MYRWLDVWSRKDNGTMVVYRCVENIVSSKYMVDRAELFEGSVTQEEMANSRSEQIEMLREILPERRQEEFDTLLLAIEAHDIYFENTEK
jgi:hypothetical protein